MHAAVGFALITILEVVSVVMLWPRLNASIAASERNRERSDKLNALKVWFMACLRYRPAARQIEKLCRLLHQLPRAATVTAPVVLSRLNDC